MNFAITKILVTTVLALVLVLVDARAQEKERDIIQFSGVVVTEDSTIGIPGVHLYVPRGGRGTSTNPYGYFSFPLLEGDSVVITAIGFKKKHVIIPDLDKDNYTVIIPLEDDTTYLENVDIMPFPTEQMFKEAILAMNLPNRQDITNMDRNMDPAVLAQIYRNMGMDGSMNHRYFTQMQAQYLFDAYGPRPNPLLNPFAWAEFFKSLKKKK